MDFPNFRVLYFNVPAYGHISPSLALMQRLAEDGEEIFHFSSHKFDSLIKATGAINLTYERYLEFDTAKMAENFIALAGYLLDFTNHLLASEFVEQVSRLNPDYIVHDQLSVWGRYIAKILKLPAINVLTTFAINRKTVKKRFSFAKGTMALKGLRPSLLVSILKLQLRLHRRFGIRPEPLIKLFGNFEDLNIVYTSRFFQPFEEEFDNRFVFIGPSFENRLKTEKAVIDVVVNPDRPIVYISLGTLFSNNVDFYKTCFLAFAKMPFQFILSVGNNVDVSKLRGIPRNFIVHKSVPQLEVLKKTAVFITHGGMNSVQEAIFFSVPMVVIPQGADQPLVAMRVSELEAGVALMPTAVTPERLKQALEKVYLDPRYRRNCKIIAEYFTASGGTPKALAAIVEFKKSKNIT